MPKLLFRSMIYTNKSGQYFSLCQRHSSVCSKIDGQCWLPNPNITEVPRTDTALVVSLGCSSYPSSILNYQLSFTNLFSAAIGHGCA